MSRVTLGPLKNGEGPPLLYINQFPNREFNLSPVGLCRAKPALIKCIHGRAQILQIKAKQVLYLFPLNKKGLFAWSAENYLRAASPFFLTQKTLLFPIFSPTHEGRLSHSLWFRAKKKPLVASWLDALESSSFSSSSFCRVPKAHLHQVCKGLLHFIDKSDSEKYHK